MPPTARDIPPLTTLLVLSAWAVVFGCGITANIFADPDMWHQMALSREAFRLGELPTRDLFAYPPTLNSSIHHEWGNGALLYVVSLISGAPGIMVLKYLLTAAIVVAVVYCARLKGAGPSVLCSLLPVPMLLSFGGFSTIRAQMFTMLALAIMLRMIDRDRDGQRRWILPWLIVYCAWLNVHGGFGVGLVLFFVYADS